MHVCCKMAAWSNCIYRNVFRSIPQLVVVSAFLTLWVLVTLVVNKHSVDKRALCEPTINWARAVALPERKLNSDVVDVTRIELKKSPIPKVAGNVLSKKNGEEVISIFAEGAGHVKFKHYLDSNLNNTLNERAAWPMDKWDNETTNKLQNNTEDGVVIIALSNFGMKEMTMNWIASLKISDYKRFVVLCFDFAMYRFLAEHGLEDNAAMIPSSWYNMTLETEFVQWGDQRYLAMLHGKILVILELLKRGFTILHSDVDIVFLSPFVVKHLLGEDKDINSDFIYMVDESNREGDVISTSTLSRLYELS